MSPLIINISHMMSMILLLLNYQILIISTETYTEGARKEYRTIFFRFLCILMKRI